MKFAPMQHSTFLVSVKKWIPPKPCSSRHSLTRMAQDTLELLDQVEWSMVAQWAICTRDPDLNQWYVVLIVTVISFKIYFYDHVFIRIFE